MAHPLPLPTMSGETEREKQEMLERNTTYIGLSPMVPRDLRSLCTCAEKQGRPGIFFVRVICKNEIGSRRVAIAALPHYFDADDVTYERHVRMMTLSEAQFALLLPYDRRLAGMATSDVLDCILEHIKQIQQKTAQHTQPAVRPDRPALAHTKEQPHQAEVTISPCKQDHPKEMKVIHTASLSIETIKVAVSQEASYHTNKQQKWTPRASNRRLVAIAAALLAAKQRREEAQSSSERRMHLLSVKALRRVLRERSQRRPVVEIEPRGGNVISVRISVPVA